MYTPVNLSFTIEKLGLRGSKLYRCVFVMLSLLVILVLSHSVRRSILLCALLSCSDACIQRILRFWYTINVKKIAFGTKEHTTDKKMGVSFFLRLFISSNEVCNTAYALQRIHEQNSIFKYTTMGPMIPKEMKYNLHYGDVRGDVLPPPHSCRHNLLNILCCKHKSGQLNHSDILAWSNRVETDQTPQNAASNQVCGVWSGLYCSPLIQQL